MCMIVSDCDKEFISQFRWRRLNGLWVCSSSAKWGIWQIHKRSLAWFIIRLGGYRGGYVQYINGDSDDCRRENLRVLPARHRQMLKAQGARYYESLGIWQALVPNGKGKRKYSGRYASEEEARKVFESFPLPLNPPLSEGIKCTDRLLKPVAAGEHQGVTYHPGRGLWKGEWDGQVGWFKTMEEAYDFVQG